MNTQQISQPYTNCKNWFDKCLWVVEQQRQATALDVAKMIIQHEPTLDLLRVYSATTQHLSTLYRVKKLGANKVGKGYVYYIID